MYFRASSEVFQRAKKKKKKKKKSNIETSASIRKEKMNDKQCCYNIKSILVNFELKKRLNQAYNLWCFFWSIDVSSNLLKQDAFLVSSCRYKDCDCCIGSVSVVESTEYKKFMFNFTGQCW